MTLSGMPDRDRRPLLREATKRSEPFEVCLVGPFGQTEARSGGRPSDLAQADVLRNGPRASAGGRGRRRRRSRAERPARGDAPTADGSAQAASRAGAGALADPQRVLLDEHVFSRNVGRRTTDGHRAPERREARSRSAIRRRVRARRRAAPSAVTMTSGMLRSTSRRCRFARTGRHARPDSTFGQGSDRLGVEMHRSKRRASPPAPSRAAAA